MALIAINAVIHIPAEVRVMEIGCVSVPMASRALKDSIVTGVRMASRTDPIGVPVIHIEPGVIERRSGPRRGGVAAGTARREPGGRMVGIVGPLIFRRVTAIAVGGKTGVVIVDVATRTGRAGVLPGQRKRCVVMIKRPLGPSHGVVAHLAGGRKTQLNVVHRAEGIVEVGLVARNAGGAPQTVVVTDMAGTAGCAYVRPGQGKAG